MEERGGGGRLFGRSMWSNMRIGGFSLERGGSGGDSVSATPARLILPVKHAKTTGGLPDILEHPAGGGAARAHRGLLPQCLVQRYRRPPREQPPPRPARDRASSVCSSYTTSSSRLSRSPSPLSSSYYSSLSGTARGASSGSSSSTARRSVLSPTPAPEPQPRRVFPQEPTFADLDGIEGKDDSPVVFDVNLSFDLGSPPSSICGSSPRRGARAMSEAPPTSTRVRQRLVPMAAHLDQQTASAFLTSRIASFLQRTDHVMHEWKRLGRKDPDEELRELSLAGGPPGLPRSRSAASIMTKAVKYYRQQNVGSSSRCSSRGSSMVRSPSVSRDDATLSELDEVRCDTSRRVRWGPRGRGLG
ncbi:uncharacterized protein LOC127750039 [Frankliniella occidentalis]|uniref:Uncharacterized protein LOC127750039 n=1 Tax=Frankliniella occidentalis TaxID=133901 RepID=A0A9C6UA63_FRAOC|nr:uncharacterized protein LOC127750039 [Frankliniella occidentalis]